MAHILSIVYTPVSITQRPGTHFARVPLQRAVLLEKHGIAGDAKGRKDSRQLNVMLAETVKQLRAAGFQTAPGELGEQIVIAGFATESIEAGVRVRLGEEAVIEMVYPRVPCSRFARIQSKPKDDARGKIGFMARVVHGGEIAVGDEVSVEGISLSRNSEAEV